MLAGIGGLAAGALLVGRASAGPLDPPPGPIAPTPGPEPRIAINQTNTPGDAGAVFRITQSGSYYLTGNLQIPSGLVGIEIAQSDVTIDLNGFRIEGFLGLSSHGIIVPSAGIARRNITIRNGAIVTCGGSGIDLTSSSHNAVETVHVRGNTGDGIRTGDSSRVVDCSAEINGGKGINVGQNAIVQNCIAQANGGMGIYADRGSTVSMCTSRSNTTIGIYGTDGCTVMNCSAVDNAEKGIQVARGGTIINCSAFNNTGIGIAGSEASSIMNCSVSFSSNIGILALTGSVVENCASINNVDSGIYVNGGTSVIDCSARFNSADGIFCDTGSLIRGNTCAFNGFSGDGAGIRAFGPANRIEGNNCSENDRGIEVDTHGSIIINNSCSGNTVNWNIAAGNSFLIVQAATTASNFTGNAGGSGVGSTNPHANFTY